MRVVVVALALVTAALLETTLFPQLTLAGYRPDLMLLLTVAFALREGTAVGLRIGFASGLLVDLLVAQSAVGVHALVLLAVGYGVGQARPYLAPESVSAPLLLAFVSGFVGTAGFGIFARLLGEQHVTGGLIVQSGVFVALYNTLLAPIVVGLIARLGERFPVERAVRI